MNRNLALAALLALCSAGLRADQHDDAHQALNDLQGCNSQVQQIQSSTAVSSPNLNTLQQFAGQLSGMQPYFSAVAADLSRLNLPGLDAIRSVAVDLQVKVSTASGTTALNFSALYTALKGDCEQWQALYPQAVAALQQAAQQAPAAMATALPSLPGFDYSSVTAVPTPTAPPLVQATPTPYSIPTVGGLPPVGNGGLIPGGYVPQPPTPTAAPTPRPGDVQAQPTPQPFGALKAPLPVVAGHNGQRVWVANVQGASVGVFDARTQRFVATVPVGSNPSSLALDDGDNVLAVANAGSASVTLVDARADTVLKTLNVGATPAQVIVTHGGKAYVACQDGHSVAVIDLSLRLVLKNLSLTSRPGRMDEPNSNGQIYLTLPDEDSLAVIDTGIDEVVSVVKE